MSTHRAHIAVPAELLEEIDQTVGPRKRSAFIVRVAQAELRRLRQMALLQELRERPAWKAEDHPELAEGVDEWIGKLRAENERRVEEAEINRLSE